eukprot:scaffold8264_cov109-Isochrysis_galbana.AAC.15
MQNAEGGEGVWGEFERILLGDGRQSRIGRSAAPAAGGHREAGRPSRALSQMPELQADKGNGDIASSETGNSDKVLLFIGLKCEWWLLFKVVVAFLPVAPLPPRAILAASAGFRRFHEPTQLGLPRLHHPAGERAVEHAGVDGGAEGDRLHRGHRTAGRDTEEVGHEHAHLTGDGEAGG